MSEAAAVLIGGALGLIISMAGQIIVYLIRRKR
jgi:hypothetical protein